MTARGGTPPRATGRCLCGAVAYELRGPLRGVVNCHCRQCLRSHGNFAAYTAVKRTDFLLTEDRGLAWYRSSRAARRGFCAKCGSSLFWDGTGRDYLAVAAGSIDPPTGLKTIRHIFVASKSDYYDITDGLETLPADHDSS
ncbi:MAG: GFA family protein [Kiloniellaceae bacterium]